MTQREIERRLNEEYLRRAIESMCGRRTLHDVEWQKENRDADYETDEEAIEAWNRSSIRPNGMMHNPVSIVIKKIAQKFYLENYLIL